MAITTVTMDRKVQKFTLNTGNAGTLDIPITDGVAYRLEATVIGVNLNAGATRMFHKKVVAEVCNQTSGTPGFETPWTTDTNPVIDVLNNIVAGPPFISGGGSVSTVTWSISSTNARLTISNLGTVTNDFVAIVDVWSASLV